MNDATARLPRELSVVVPSVTGLEDLLGCLAALERQRGDVVLETLVVDRLGGGIPEEVARKFPGARVISVPLATTIPQMRALAIEAATKAAVGVVEDHVVVPEGWARRMLDAHDETGADAVGGSIANAATVRLAERAAFVCEYHQLLPPIPAGEVASVAGNNVVYRASTLAKHRDVIRKGRWENHLHDAIRAAGGKLVCRPDIVAGHALRIGFWSYMSQRYLYSRSYAGARLADAPGPRRFIYGAAAFLLPAIMFLRIVSTVGKKPGMKGELAVSLPLLVPFVLAWGWGEVVGAWFGAGDSLARVR